MLFFVAGILCLFFVFGALRRRHFAFSSGWGGHGPACGLHARRWQRRSARPSRFVARWLFEQLDTSPGQEKALRATFDRLRERLVDDADALSDVRAELAQTVADDTFDQARFDSTAAQVEQLFEKTRSQIGQTLVEVHATLDGPQRKLFAELIADGFPRVRRGLGYR